MAEVQIVAEPGVPQILMTREFAASPEALFRAHTEPDLLVQWLGPRSMTMVIDRYEVRDGGLWRYIHREADGTEYGFHGVFHGTPTVDGIVQTFEFEGAPGNVALETLTFEERDGKHGGAHQLHVPVRRGAGRDDQSGMEVGVTEGYDQLDELIAKGAAGA